VIVGYTEPRGSRKYFGSLVLAVRDKAKKRWAYAGNVERPHPSQFDSSDVTWIALFS
jgi:hypothetical protein